MLSAAGSALVRAIRGAGHALDRTGVVLQTNPVIETLQPSTRSVEFNKLKPTFEGIAFVAPTATVVGNVSIGAGSSVWYGAIVRGDDVGVSIGKNVSIGDRAMVIGDILKKTPTSIGDSVTIKAGAFISSAVVEKEVVIGEGVQVLEGAKIQARAVLAPGSLVAAGKVIPSGQVWAGRPAVYVRDLSAEEILAISSAATDTAKRAAEHAFECAKSWQELETDEFDREQVHERSEFYYPRLSKEEIAERTHLEETARGRLLDTPFAIKNNKEL